MVGGEVEGACAFRMIAGVDRFLIILASFLLIVAIALDRIQHAS
jgi:hypothetical protein